MKNILKIFVLLLFSVTLIACNDTYDDYEPNKKPSKSETETESVTSETETETTKEYTEEEYKSLCEEMYNDDFFKSTPDVGKYVKVHVMASSKYKYRTSDTQGMVVKDITKKYNLAMNCLGCTVMHESTKDKPVPSYFGDQIYLMFIEGSELNLDTFKTGHKLIIYGQIIQNKNGTFILPKYYEEEK